ncbi:MAG: flippase-like domain-containing protein [Chloroflexi bacterium]|nr:flippase-like domain-containing protein [Chloroflexota bacterium]MCI0773726.1 flippase-like domain-containing protein [Chloroflexota bacterium]MCI0828347.1 flippase-like domain-containing protein [Chloroflexota bacterium]MCI0862042.1 flippase-like domain-containing protein [Chloroflexota bacterium]
MTAESTTDRSWTRWVRLAGTLISLGLLIWLLSRLDLRELLSMASEVPPIVILYSLGLLIIRVLAHTFRWRSLLRGQKIHVPYRQLVGLQYGSFFASNFLPTTIGGDVIRLVGILRETSNRVGGAASIVVDRAIGAFGMLFVLPLSWPMLGGFLATLGVAVGRVELPGSLRKAARRVWDATALWLKSPASLVVALLASWVGIFSYFVFVWVLARALGIDVSLIQVAGVTAVTYFIALFPFTINAYGLRELSVIAFYSSLGASTEQAAALAVLSRFLILISSLPGVYTVWGAFLRKGPESD